jgi:hypothetical protein
MAMKKRASRLNDTRGLVSIDSELKTVTRSLASLILLLDKIVKKNRIDESRLRTCVSHSKHQKPDYHCPPKRSHRCGFSYLVQRGRLQLRPEPKKIKRSKREKIRGSEAYHIPEKTEHLNEFLEW